MADHPPSPSEREIRHAFDGPTRQAHSFVVGTGHSLCRRADEPAWPHRKPGDRGWKPSDVCPDCIRKLNAGDLDD